MKWLEDNYWWNYFFNFEMYCGACGRLTSLSVETHMTTAFEITETTSTWKQIYFFLLMENQGRNNNPNYQHTFTLFFLSNDRHNLCLLLITCFFSLVFVICFIQWTCFFFYLFCTVFGQKNVNCIIVLTSGPS